MHLRFSVSLGPALRGEARECHRRALADHGEPDIDDFDRLLGRMVGVALIVEAVERRPDGAAVARLDLICADGNRKREFLAYVAQIEMDPALRAFLTPERESGFPCHLLHRPLQLPEIDCAEIGIEGANEIVALVGCEHAERREMRGVKRHDHLGYVQLARDRHDVERTRPARGDQSEVARIVALRDRDLAHGERHLGDCDIDDGLRCGGQAHLQRTGDLPRDALGRGLRVEHHLPAEEILRIEPPQCKIRVGDRRLGSPAAIAYRPGIGARALRADLERADLVDPGDAAAARAHLDHVDHRHHDRVAARVPADVIARGQGGLALAYQARLCGGAAHVERDYVAKAERATDPRRSDDSPDRPGFHHRHRTLGCDLGRHHAAVRLHDRQIAAKTGFGEARFQAADIPSDFRPDVSIDHGGGHPFELAVFAQDPVGKRDVRAGQKLAHDLAGRALVLGIDVGVQEADGDGFHFFLRQAAAGLLEARALERFEHLARGEHTFVDLPGQVPRNERPVPAEKKVVGLGAVAPADEVDVARAAGDDEPGLRAFSLDQGVDGGGRAVDQLADTRAIHAALLQAIDDALHQLSGRGEALGLREPAGSLVKSHQVRESPADIDRHPQQVRLPVSAQTVSWSDEQSRRQASLPVEPGKRLTLRYHDEEWGVPVHDDRRLFEFLILEGAQAGLSWSTILNKRDGYRRAFARFDPAKVARCGARDVRRLMSDAGIVRNRLKIESAITNARAFLEVQREFGSFDRYIWSFVGGTPKRNRWKRLREIPPRTPESDAMSKDLKQRGFRFVGSTICYAFMQAVGLVNEHQRYCWAGSPQHRAKIA